MRSTPSSRLLTLTDAAAYCGVSSATFRAICPLAPIALGPGKRLERFDRARLDEWIDQLGGNVSFGERNWLAAWDAGDDARAR